MRGYGKIILFGEHAVVYGYPALATSIDVGVRCKVTSHEYYELYVPSESLIITNEDDHVLGQVFNKILSYFPQKKDYCRIELFPEIPLGAGLGSSAATSVSIIRGLLAFHELHWENTKVNEVAFAAETIFHGTPSGIDNTIACFGGMCYLREANKFPRPQESYKEIPLQKLTISLMPSLPQPLSLMIVNTKRERNTKNMVSKVRRLREKNLNFYDDIMKRIGSFPQQAIEAFGNNNMNVVGELLNQNQSCLRELEVSCEEIDFVCEKAIEYGALGAKLTGAGGGGCVIILISNRNELEKYLVGHGFEVFYALCG
ncbi:mevalonate kinase [Candidatus Uabimicrobium sp. HlEnr_7]|uniref:mevalonate kinase n=1 Tax=Candidatus Uabimicrobium helgolandensis TaxID=3095367 RepID=UPI003557E1FA